MYTFGTGAISGVNASLIHWAVQTDAIQAFQTRSKSSGGAANFDCVAGANFVLFRADSP
jgi:hypothetical protein